MRYTIKRMLRVPKNAALGARRGFLRLVAKKITDEPREQEVLSAHPVTALLPADPTSGNSRHTASRRVWDKDELRPSVTRMSQRLRMLLIKYAMMLCLVAALACVLSVPLLSSIRVRSIEVEGTVRSAGADIVTASGIKIGDELLQYDLDAVAARVKQSSHRLRSVTARRQGRTVVLTVRESEPCWALLLADGRVALVDEDGYVGEICERSQKTADVCELWMELPMLASDEQEGALVAQLATEGQYIKGSSLATVRLAELAAALDAVSLHAAPAVLDLSDVYAITLTLSDGTQLLLHECGDAERQLSYAKAALDTYFMTHPEGDDTCALVVDVDDFLRVSIRRVPKMEAEQGENTQNTEN